MNYYKIFDDVHFPQRWYLSDVEDLESNWPLVIPEKYQRLKFEDLEAGLQRDGVETDYTAGGYAHVQYVSDRARKTLMTLSGIEEQLDFLPVTIRDKELSQPYYVMVVKKQCDCVDENRARWSELSFDGDETPISRGFLRKYGAFYKLVIDPARTKDLDIFRLLGASHYIIVSERLKDAFEGAGVTGPIYTDVTPDSVE